MIRVCPHSDSQCIHGMSCKYSCATDDYNGTKTMPDNHPTAEEREGLNPCPFCGGEAELDSRQSYRAINGHFGVRAVVYCTQCGADIGLCREDHPGETLEELAEIVRVNWNSRPQPPERPKPEVGVEEWKVAGGFLYLLRDTGEFRRGVAQQANALTIRVEHDSRYATADEKAALVQAILSRLTEAASPASGGWRLVPVEPTEAMIQACLEALPAWRKTLGADERMLRRDPERLQRNGKPFEASATQEEKAVLRYRAMLAAAPTPSPLKEEDERP